MQHIIFEENTTYKVALLIKQAAFDKTKLKEVYVDNTSVDSKDIIGFTLDYKDNGKAPVAFAREYATNLLKALRGLGTETLYVCDSNYFKVLTGAKKVESAYGYVKSCVIKGYEDINVILGTNYQALFYNPDLQDRLDLSLETLNSHVNGFHVDIGSNIIHSSKYPKSEIDIANCLDNLHSYPELTCDIEAFGLKHYETGIGTIGFAWDKHNGISFPVDYREFITGDQCTQEDDDGRIVRYHGSGKKYGEQIDNQPVKKLLKEFFDTYLGKITYHNANYDVKIMINDLYMKDLLDQKGMIEGINTLGRNIGDTKLISYLATNSCAGNKLSLKHQAHEFAGDYAEGDIEDITKIPMGKLLKYNLVDCLCTWYVHDKHYPTMIADAQGPIYSEIFLPSVRTILQMELTGVPLDMDQVLKSEMELLEIQAEALDLIIYSPHIALAEELLEERFLEKDFADRKKKAKNPDKIKPKDINDINIDFNVGSPKQLGVLLYDIIGLPIIDTTDTGQPATGAKTLDKLVNHTSDIQVIDLLTQIITYTKAAKITSTFIKAFKNNSVLKSDGLYYLHGGYNLGGTVSGRLSSSQPNLQNIPSGSTYAKLIKRCFIAPEGWLMAGADFDSLEDKISALTTKDSNKIKVYTDKYDGHCLRAYSYFGSQMPDIVNTVDSINSIAVKYPELRQDSKAPTFLLTYGGTYHGMMNNLGWSEKVSKDIETNYHTLYKDSDTWVQNKLIGASDVGYVTCAFGLRVRTPILKQTLLNKKSTPYEASAESRTAGNALGQSYGLLNNRAGIEFQERVFASEYWADIKPIMQIHDAMYFLVRNKLDIVKWFNDNLPDCMSWQKLPEIEHDQVKLSGAVDIFYPNWSVATGLPNNATKQEILDLC
jgi:DNA polymerase-1